MSHPGLIVVVDRKRARVFVDRWLGARVFDLLDGGAAAVEQAVQDLPTSRELPTWAEAAWLADLEERRLLLLGDPSTTYIGEEEMDAAEPPAQRAERAIQSWVGFETTWATDVESLRDYLDGRQVPIEVPTELLEEAASDATSRLWKEIDIDRAALVEALQEEERALGPAAATSSAPPRHTAGRILFLGLVVTILPAALLTRLVTIPWRQSIRDWMGERETRRSARNREALARAAAARNQELSANPDSIHAQLERGLALLAVGDYAGGAHDFDVCARRLASAPPPGKATLAVALHNRGVAREHLKCPQLAQRDLDQAAAIGFRLKRTGEIRRVIGLLRWAYVFGFCIIAGLAPD